ncbi:phosphomannomutase/phosphoglucomutase [Sutterella wadsworthensis]|uniref:phosphomannomutase/phosphoglucomutase n=1 Tax=Sutterella wadsworthensis TaxID=40545 RepID=UPI0013F5C609|nr:phosphomannomutase/phosphoglucomutase [Sutterella wadsworthensis]
MQVDSSIFKAYDIRGVVDKTLTEDVARAVGRVLGSLAVEANVSAFCVGRDGRLSGERLMNALVEGIASTGMKVLDVGAVPTPVLYYATKYFNCGTGVAVTGSHNPPEWNGLKMMVAGITLFADAIQDIRRRVEVQDWIEATVPGGVEKVDAVTPYIEKALAGIKIGRRLKVAADAGSGIAGPVMLQLLSKLPVDVVPLFCEPDGRFPFHHPDPSKPKNLEDLIKTVKTEDCDYGFALDGDGDRLGVVTKQGEIIFPDRLMMLFAEDILKHHPGEPIVYDVKCSRKLVDWVKAKGGVPTISPTGHSLVKAKLRDTHAPFAGEMSGHLFFNDERWTGFDDGLYAAVRLLEILSRTDDPSGVLSKLPNAVNTPELQIPMAEGEPKRFIERLRAEAGQFTDAADVIKVDGLRVEWKDGFALARSSNTTPVVVLRFEGDTPEALKRVKTRFIEVLRSIEPNLVIPE